MTAHRIIVKFVEGSNVRLSHGRLRRNHKPTEEIELPGCENIVIERYFAEDELSIEKERQELLKTTSPEQVPDLNLYYALIPIDKDQERALWEFLESFPLVESAYVEEEPDLAETGS